MKKSLNTAVIALGLAALVGCSDMNTTQQRTLSGAGIGAATGAAAGLLTGGHVGTGAAIGAAAGAGAGYLYDKSQK